MHHFLQCDTISQQISPNCNQPIDLFAFPQAKKLSPLHVQALNDRRQSLLVDAVFAFATGLHAALSNCAASRAECLDAGRLLPRLRDVRFNGSLGPVRFGPTCAAHPGFQLMWPREGRAFARISEVGDLRLLQEDAGPLQGLFSNCSPPCSLQLRRFLKVSVWRTLCGRCIISKAFGGTLPFAFLISILSF